MIVMLLWLVGMIVHITHHKEMCERAQEKQPKIDNRVHGYLEQEDCG
jgi:hypothetical protein